jgi:thiosulfate dehydrogenase (quinone) large subunit
MTIDSEANEGTTQAVQTDEGGASEVAEQAIAPLSPDGAPAVARLEFTPQEGDPSAPRTVGARISRFPPHNLQISNWLYRSREASFLWLVVRCWLGYEWVNAGYQKIWGSEKSVFWFGSGAGVKGFATAGVVGSATGKGGASYGWWAAFLHNFVVPNASWIGRFISLAELLIGIGLILGLLTGAAAFGGLVLNLTYMFSGSAGVNPAFSILAVLLVLAWRNAGWIGLDRFVLQNAWTPHRLDSVFGRVLHRRAPAAAPAH